MKSSVRHRSSYPFSPGFTLLELLVVITLIAVLAAMAIWGAGGILKASQRKQIKQFMAEIESGLAKYKLENAIYPLNPDPNASGSPTVPGYVGPDAEAVAGAAVLYQHLSGDFDKDGRVDEDGTVYVAHLDFWSNSERNGKTPERIRAVEIDSEYLVVDPLGSPMRYLADPPGREPEKRQTRNPGYDLWSIAGAEIDSPDFSDQSTWITNWGSN